MGKKDKVSMLTTADVANMLNRSPKTIRKYAAKMGAIKLGRDLLYDSDKVEEFKKQLRVVK